MLCALSERAILARSFRPEKSSLAIMAQDAFDNLLQQITYINQSSHFHAFKNVGAVVEA